MSISDCSIRGILNPIVVLTLRNEEQIFILRQKRILDYNIQSKCRYGKIRYNENQTKMKGRAHSPPRSQANNGGRLNQKHMSIVLCLGRNVNEYIKNSAEIIAKAINSGVFGCKICFAPMKKHSNYDRGIKETGQIILIIVVWCRKCKKYHALLPDFLLPNKHYSGGEIESVIIESGQMPIDHIETAASESTVRRWISQIGAKISEAVSILKYLFREAGQLMSEIMIEPGHCYSELEQVLERAPRAVKYSGCKLGLANIWLGTNKTPAYI